MVLNIAGARGWVVALILLLVAAVAGLAIVRLTPSPEAGATGEAGERPNIILITSDDQRADDMSAMPRTKELIGEQGTTFDRAYAPFPLCCPSRASMLTGQYAHNHGVLGNGGSNGIGGYQDFDGSSTLATWLQDAGYSTSFVGKYLNKYGATEPLVVPPGWDDFRASVGGGEYFDTRLFENGETHRYQDVYQTDLYADISTEMITARAEDAEPFFLWASYYAPHTARPEEEDNDDAINTPDPAPRHEGDFADEPLPMDPSFNEGDVSDKPGDVSSRPRFSPRVQENVSGLHQLRLESLLALDEAIEQMLTALEATGELDNTIVLFTSDNGYMLGEHRIPAGKTEMYEPSARIPLLVRGPGFPAGVTREQPVALIDLAPTFVEAARTTAGLTMDGVSLRPPARDPDAGTERVLVVEAGPDAVGQEWKYRGVRDSRYVYVEYGVTGETELYDMAEDPYQLDNLAFSPDEASSQLIADMADLLESLRDCAGATCQR